MIITKKIKNQGKRLMDYIYGEGVDRKAKPEKSLTRILRRRAGRMRTGKISIRHRGGGVKRRYRIVDFSSKVGKFKVERLEKDPNRSSFIALVSDKDGNKSYTLAIQGMKSGAEFSVGEDVEIKSCNRTILKKIPAGTLICNVEMIPQSGGKIARSAGSFVKMMGVENGLAQIQMPSGEIRQVKDCCYATIGQISNPENNIFIIGKAGRKRLMGWRPQVRGKVMNPVDHPHGGGEGNQPIGLKYPKTPWGKHALGVRTRRKRNSNNKYIVRRRKKKR